MSLAGSLVPFDDGSGPGRGARQPIIVPAGRSSSPGASSSRTATSAPSSGNGQAKAAGNGPANSAQKNGRTSRTARTKKCLQTHVNSLWSVWYGLGATAIQAYIAVEATRRFIGFLSLPWPVSAPPPRSELHLYVCMLGAAMLILPFFLASALLRVGNLANDGFKLGRQLAACSTEPGAAQLGAGGAPFGGKAIRALWLHGGPTAPFLHLTIAILLLLPRLFMEARLIQSGFLPKDMLWRTDLDWMLLNRDRLVVLSFVQKNHSAFSNLMSTTTSPLGSTSWTWRNLAGTSGGTSDTPWFMPTPQPVLATSTPRTAPLLNVDRALQDWAVSPVDLQNSTHWSAVSPEFLNYSLALLVYAVRYPSVFWHTNKAFGTLFSMQLVVNGVQALLAYAGICVLYKVQVYGTSEAVPLQLPRSSRDDQPFLLNSTVTLCLYVMSSLLVLSSSLVLYLYGYGRLHAFLSSESARRVIRLRDARGSGWGYFTHCAALCVLLCCAVCEAPLLHDWAQLYRGSLDGAVLVTVCACIFHLLVWVILWLILTIKQKWVFKLRVTVGHAMVRSARSVRLVTDVELLSGRRRAGAVDHNSSSGGSSTAPLLVVGNGRSYTVAESEPKKAIMGVIQKSQLERKARQQHGASNGGCSMADPTLDDGDEQIYWLRPKIPSPKNSPAPSERLTWLNRKLGGSPAGSSGSAGSQKHKVTFDDSAKKGARGRSVRGKGGNLLPEVDDGDYATLRELPLVTSMADSSDDTASEENKLVNCSRSTYDHSLRPGDYEDPSPLLTPQPLGPPSDQEDPDDLPPPPPLPSMPSMNAHQVIVDAQIQGSVTPRQIRRGDSGMPHDILTPRSDSVSTESSGCTGSPPGGVRSHSTTNGGDSNASNASNDTSSGVHSNSSATSADGPPAPQARRANSVTDLCLEPPRAQPATQWKSFSLQRNVMPPTAMSPPPVMSHIIPPQLSQAQQQLLQNQPIYSFGGIHKPQVQHSLQQIQQMQQIQEQMQLKMQQLQMHEMEQLELAANAENSSIPQTQNGVPAVVVESPESTVVIRRKQSRPKTTSEISQQPVISEEPFGRSTNMRMTSFTDQPDSKPSSATLPHYPTQPPVSMPTVHPHCATLPTHTSGAGTGGLASSAMASAVQGNLAGGSCGNFPRPHTTIPTHHNGVRLFAGPSMPSSGPQVGIYAKRLQPTGRSPLYGNMASVIAEVPTQCCSVAAGSALTSLNGHHSLIQGMSPMVKYSLQQHLRADKDPMASKTEAEYTHHT